MKAELFGKVETVRVFEKEKSVFKYWIKDSYRSLEETAFLDMKSWKVHRFCKDETDYMNLEKIIVNNFATIKHIFTILISTPDYPTITQLTMGNWAQ